MIIIEIDKSLEINLTFKKIELNIRQIDFTYFMRCNDLNMMYTDNLYKYYMYSQINSKDGITQEKKLPLYTDDSLLSMLVKLSIFQFEIKLFRDDTSIITELVLIDKTLIFKKTLTNKSELSIKISKSKAFQYLNNRREGKFISFISQVESIMVENNLEGSRSKIKEQININFVIEPDREKTVFININNIKIFLRMDIMNLIKTFFLEGFPNYENIEHKDLPNMCKYI